jgi:hypothetical protein
MVYAAEKDGSQSCGLKFVPTILLEVSEKLGFFSYVLLLGLIIQGRSDADKQIVDQVFHGLILIMITVCGLGFNGVQSA